MTYTGRAYTRLLNEVKLLCLLGVAAESASLRRVSVQLGIDASVLSKYLNLQIKPRAPRIRELLKKLEACYDTRSAITTCLENPELYAFPEMNNISWNCPYVYYCILYEFAIRLVQRDFSAFLTAEGGGLYIATGLQLLFPRKKLLYAMRDVLVQGGYSLRYKHTPAYALGPRIKRYLTLPVKNILKEEKIVIIDDFMWTGDTVKALVKYARTKGAQVTLVLVVGARPGLTEMISSEMGVEIEALTPISV